jgi:hypothetical protein
VLREAIESGNFARYLKGRSLSTLPEASEYPSTAGLILLDGASNAGRKAFLEMGPSADSCDETPMQPGKTSERVLAQGCFREAHDRDRSFTGEREHRMRAIFRQIRVFVAAAAGLSGSLAMTADVNHAAELAKRWCATCHVVDGDQKQASADVPPFATIARKSDFTPEKVAFFTAYIGSLRK